VVLIDVCIKNTGVDLIPGDLWLPRCVIINRREGIFGPTQKRHFQILKRHPTPKLFNTDNLVLAVFDNCLKSFLQCMLYSERFDTSCQITKQQDVTNLSKRTGQAIVSYGQEYSKLGHIVNTGAGVMVMNVERFEQELPKMLQQARDEEVYPGQAPGFDEQLLKGK
jgi:hypothetical protein